MKPQKRGADLRYDLTITFEEAVLVARKRLSYHAGRHVHIVMVTVRNLVRHRRLCVVPSVVVQVIRKMRDFYLGQFVDVTRCEHRKG